MAALSLTAFPWSICLLITSTKLKAQMDENKGTYIPNRELDRKNRDVLVLISAAFNGGNQTSKGRDDFEKAAVLMKLIANPTGRSI